MDSEVFNIVCFVVSVVILVQSYMSIPLAQAVVLFLIEFRCTSLMVEIAKEIELTLPAQDTAKNKSVSAFLMEIARSNPRVIVPIVDDLISYLHRGVSIIVHNLHCPDSSTCYLNIFKFCYNSYIT